MAKFRSVYPNLCVIVEPRVRVYENGVNSIRAGKKVHFSNGVLATEDKDVIECLRKCALFNRDFFEEIEGEVSKKPVRRAVV